MKASQPSTASPHSVELRKNALTAVALFGLGVLVYLMCLASYGEPYERDITTYAVIAHEMLQGRPLYSDLWDIKPPLIFQTYGLAEKIWGYGPMAIFGMVTSCALLTLVGVFGTVWASTGARRWGLLGASFWTLVSSALVVQANQPNVEVFLNATLVWGLCFYQCALAGRGKAEPGNTRGPVWLLLCAGVCFGIASLFKQYTFLTPLALAALYGIVARKTGDIPARAAWHLLWPTLVLWGLTVAYFVKEGVGPDMYRTLVVFGKVYASDPTYATRGPWASLLPYPLYFLLPLFAVAVAGFWVGRSNAGRWLPVLCFGATMVAIVIVPRKYFPHYFQLYLPSLCLLGALGFHSLHLYWQKLSWPAWSQRTLGYALPLAALAHLGNSQFPNYQLTPEQWSLKKYGRQFLVTRDLGELLARNLKPGDTFYQYGWETGLYFFSKKPVPDGLIVNYALTTGPDVDHFNRRIIENLSRRPPGLAVVPPQAFPSATLNWIKTYYRVIGEYEGFKILAHKDSSYIPQR